VIHLGKAENYSNDITRFGRTLGWKFYERIQKSARNRKRCNYYHIFMSIALFSQSTFALSSIPTPDYDRTYFFNDFLKLLILGLTALWRWAILRSLNISLMDLVPQDAGFVFAFGGLLLCCIQESFGVIFVSLHLIVVFSRMKFRKFL
jgi:hypothetical protein